MQVEIIEADLDNEEHAAAVLRLTDIYSRDAMGMEEPLPNSTHISLIQELNNFPTAFSLLAYREGEAVGLANCFISLSTFEARKLINIHDLVVIPDLRGLGIGDKLLTAIQKKAKELDCIKITLEVREDNPARQLYERFGFENDEPKMWFMVKDLF